MSERKLAVGWFDNLPFSRVCAPYLERISHLNAWLGGETVKIFDLTGGGHDAE